MYKVHYEDMPNIELARVLSTIMKCTLTVDTRFYNNREVNLYIRHDELMADCKTGNIVERAVLSMNSLEQGIKVTSNLSGNWEVYTEANPKENETNPVMTFIKVIKHALPLYEGDSYSQKFLVLNTVKSPDIPEDELGFGRIEQLIKIEELKNAITATESTFNLIKNMPSDGMSDTEKMLSNNFMSVSETCMRYQKMILKYKECELERSCRK